MVLALLLAAGLFSIAVALAFRQRVLALSVEAGAASPEEASRLRDIAAAIAEGAMAFLLREYRALALYMLGFAILIALLIDDPLTPVREGVYTAIAFLCGAFCSVLAGFIGMRIATHGNVRTASSARISLAHAFRTAFQSGAVMGFGLAGIAIVGLVVVYLGLDWVLHGVEKRTIMEVLSGFALGGSSVALFARVGGGIYTKAADVGADLVGKVETGIPEDDPRNPAVIADNVGDNVGDIAGMGADLFGSVAESTCAALVIGAVAFPENLPALFFPLAISAIGVLCSFIAVVSTRVRTEADVENALRRSLLIATILLGIGTYIAAETMLPETFTIFGQQYTALGVFFSVLVGLLAGLITGVVTDYFTSNRFRPVQELADSARTGAATVMIGGLAIGYNSAVVPALLLALTAIVGYTLGGMYGVAVAALGMLGTIATALTIDAYGPVADNAGGIAEMAAMGREIRQRTDVLDAAGNTTAAIGKGFAIGSAALTALALFSAFITRAQEFAPELDILHTTSLLDPWVLAGLLIGGVLPFAFSALTMRAVGRAAFDMIEEVRRQFREIPGLLEGKARADYRRCVDISTKASLREMIAPGLLVLGTPLVAGFLFGLKMLSGVLIGAIVSGVALATSMANSGAAWDNAKKYIEKGYLGGKGSDAHKAAVIGDTVGDPFKDTSGPSLNILIKLMAILSLVFVPFFVRFSLQLFQ
ncbi:Putative K(+)-stimulated pyrophosphate-energized sodium pump [bacterium HR21]|nr:Putative K(+)-stimulated pyrophosphate-energized sodium pump [bacterium HR21]